MDTTSHIPPGVTKKRGVGLMDVVGKAIDGLDDVKRKKVMHDAVRALLDTENELQDAVKRGEVAKVAEERAVKHAQDAEERAVKRAQDAEERVQVLDGVLDIVYEREEALQRQLEVAEKRAQDAEEREEALQQQLEVAAEKRASVLDGVCVLIKDKDALKQQLEVAEKREEALQQQLEVEISNARSAQALTFIINQEWWQPIVYGTGFNEIVVPAVAIETWPKVSSFGRYQPPDGSEIIDLRWWGEVYIHILGREYCFPALVARAFLGPVPDGCVGVAYRHGHDNAPHNLEYLAN